MAQDHPIGSTPRRRVAANALAGGAASAVRVATQLIMLPLMAKLLGPAEYGLYALALPTLWFFNTLADAGLGVSLSREEEGSTRVWSTAFWIMVGTGVVFSLLVTLWGFLLAMFSGQPRVTGLMAALSVTFLFVTMSVLPSARLMRRGRLVVYAWADFASTVLGAAVAIPLAIAGAGAWSLAAQYVVQYLTRAIIMNAAAFEWPTLEFDLKALRGHMSTGGYLISGRLAEFAGRMVENLLYGRIFGVAALGGFAFANQAPRSLFDTVSKPIWNAVYSHALHETPMDVAKLHRDVLRLVAFTFLPVAFLIAASAPELLDVVLGSRWAGAAAQTAILMPCYGMAGIALQSGAVLLANGRNVELFWSLIGLTLVRLGSVSVGWWFGTIPVAWLLGLSNIAYAMMIVVFASRLMSASLFRLAKDVLACLGASMLAGLACYVLLGLRPPTLPWIIVSLMLGALSYLAVMIVLDRKGFGDLLAMRRLASSRRA